MYASARFQPDRTAHGTDNCRDCSAIGQPGVCAAHGVEPSRGRGAVAIQWNTHRQNGGHHTPSGRCDSCPQRRLGPRLADHSGHQRKGAERQQQSVAGRTPERDSGADRWQSAGQQFRAFQRSGRTAVLQRRVSGRDNTHLRSQRAGESAAGGTGPKRSRQPAQHQDCTGVMHGRKNSEQRTDA